MTYTQVLIADNMVGETWEHQAALNNRGRLHVFRVGRVRFRADSRKRVSRKELERTGWKLIHVFAREK